MLHFHYVTFLEFSFSIGNLALIKKRYEILNLVYGNENNFFDFPRGFPDDWEILKRNVINLRCKQFHWYLLFNLFSTLFIY